MSDDSLRLYFENSVGRVSEKAVGRRDGHVVVEYHAGPRRMGELQTLLGHAKQLLTRRGWHKFLGDQRLLSPFTDEEFQWLSQYWLQMAQQRNRACYGAVLLPSPVFASLPTEQSSSEGQVAAMTYRLFEDPIVAEEWLVSLP